MPPQPPGALPKWLEKPCSTTFSGHGDTDGGDGGGSATATSRRSHRSSRTVDLGRGGMARPVPVISSEWRSVDFLPPPSRRDLTDTDRALPDLTGTGLLHAWVTKFGHFYHTKPERPHRPLPRPGEVAGRWPSYSPPCSSLKARWSSPTRSPQTWLRRQLRSSERSYLQLKLQSVVQVCVEWRKVGDSCIWR